MSRWRTRAVRVGAGVTVLAVLVGGSVAAYAAHGDAPDDYRTARVALGDVDQVLALSGTVDPSGRSDLAFATSGTVVRLAVGVGEKVTRGQALAALDTTTLKAAVTQANAQLAAARAQLAQDEDAQTSTVTSATTTSTSSTTAAVTSPTTGVASSGKVTGSTQASSTQASSTKPSSNQASSTGPSAGSSSSATSKALEQLSAQQHAVEVAQKAVDTAIAASRAALEQEQSVCAADTTSSTSGDPSAVTGAASDTSDTSGADACQAAIEAVQAAQQAVADAEYSGSGNLKDALAALAETLTDAAKAAAAPVATGSAKSSGGTKSGQQAGAGSSGQGSSGPGSSAPGSTSPGSTSSGTASSTAGSASQSSAGNATTSSGMSGGGQTVTAATLAKDQATIDSARATLIEASQSLSGATIKAPSGGTVAQISVTKGGSASAGTTALVVIAPGTTTVDLSVSSTQVAELKVGQKARVTPAGADQTYPGTVTQISRIPTTSSTGTSTYPVTVTLAGKRLSLLAGSTAVVDLTLGSASDVLTVPTSAVSNGSVQVLEDGEVTRTRVTTGLVGSARTVISDGLEAGQEVVLADLSADLPTSDSQSTTRGFGGGGFSGGGLSGGAPPSGGLPGGGFGG